MTRSLLATGVAVTLVFSALTTSLSARADEWHIAGSYSTDQMRGARIGYRWTNIPLNIIPDWGWLGQPKLHLEAAVNSWQNSNDRSDNIFAATLSPVLAWQLMDGPRPLYLEAGVGASYLDTNHINGHRLSTGFQFEDRIGLSWQYSAYSLDRLTLSYVHYSNANIERPNHGLDLITLTWTKPI